VIEPRTPIKRTVAQGDAVQRPSTLYLNVEWDTSNPRIFVGGDVVELGRGTVKL
jgi:predicted PhzF superfamily epimerase YddE/YHI9